LPQDGLNVTFMVKAVFFDIGDVLFNEDVQHTWLLHSILLTLRRHGKRISWDEFNAERVRLTTTGPNPEDAIKASLLAFCDTEIEGDKLWTEARADYQMMRAVRPYGFLLDGIELVLKELKPQFKLGVVANQHPPVADALAEYGIDALFDVIVISETVRLFKPDPAIFRLALDRLGLNPAEVVFVGDRPDNDVRPAKALGMRTIRFKRGIQYTLFNPSDPEMTADITVTDVSALVAAVRTLAAQDSTH
jgi:HAD superfamily hydrolase (TIGR01549 family)